MKNENITSLDTDQVWRRIYDEKTDSFRASLIGDGSVTINVDTDKLARDISQIVSLNTQPKQEVSQSSPEIHIEPIVIREPSEVIYVDKVVTDTKTVIERVEVPVIVKQIEYKEVELPVYIPQIKIVEIEKPVIANIELPKWFNVLLVLQTVAIIGLIVAQIRR